VAAGLRRQGAGHHPRLPLRDQPGHGRRTQASNKSIAFGDWSKFWIRDVRNPLIIRANELYLANGQIGFFLFSRHGSNVIDAGTDPSST
jgi:hypothetical protein